VKLRAFSGVGLDATAKAMARFFSPPRVVRSAGAAACSPARRVGWHPLQLGRAEAQFTFASSSRRPARGALRFVINYAAGGFSIVFADFCCDHGTHDDHAAAFADHVRKTVLIDVLLCVRPLPLIFEEIHQRRTLVFGLIVFICYSDKKKKKTEVSTLEWARTNDAN
jgi:hypothetical protein